MQRSSTRALVCMKPFHEHWGGDGVLRAQTLHPPRLRRGDTRSHPVLKRPNPSDADAVDRAGDIVVTAADYERLKGLIPLSRNARDRDAAEALADELERAEVVPAERIAGNVVTMNSRVVFRDEETGENREVLLVYPEDSDPEHGQISIFAPVGTALLGLSVGQTIDWPLPLGRLKRYRVIEVSYQPEAAATDTSKPRS